METIRNHSNALTVPNAESGEEQRLIFGHILEIEVQTGQLELSRLHGQRHQQLQKSNITSVRHVERVEVRVLCYEKQMGV